MKKDIYELSKEGSIRLNLGCGHKIMDGFINIDSSDQVDCDICLDLTKTPYTQFEDNSVDYILTEFFLEHIPKHTLIPVLDEWYRISKANAIWEIKVPFYNSRQRANLTHYYCYDFTSFDFLNPDHKRHYYCNAKAEVLEAKPIVTMRGKFIPFKMFLRHSIGELYDGIIFKLRIIK